MHFEIVLKHLLQLFEEKRVKYALLKSDDSGLLGSPKATAEFLIPLEFFDQIDPFFVKHDYRRIVQTDLIASYLPKNPILGRVDILFSQARQTDMMIKNAHNEKLSQKVGAVKYIPEEECSQIKKLIGKKKIDFIVKKIRSFPVLKPLEYIRWLDEYQRAFGQFPVSHELPTYYKMA